MGFGIKKEAGSNTTPSEIVNFDKLTPTTAGVVFDPNTPATLDVLYLSTVDASTWIWNGTAYVTYTAPATATTEWYLLGTTIDAGSNKTAAISRVGAIVVGADSYFTDVRVGRGRNNIVTNTVVGNGAGITITTGTNNTFIGNGSGNLNTTASNGTFLGLNSGRNNTTAVDNTFIGKSSGLSTTTGGANTGNGVNSLLSNTTGTSNVANGGASLYSNTTGGGNTSNGVESLYSSTTGFFNTASGYRAGRYIADGTTELTASGNSVFLGADTKALGNSQTNQIVIGYNTIGKGSNTVNIGNTSITNTYLNGAVTFNNAFTFPTTDGTSGYFLKTNGSGTVTWGTAGSSSGIWGIANSSGVYTYYATWALAVAAATSGQCIELFADITENTVGYTLKNGVNINGNGHSISSNTNTATFTDGGVAVTCDISNIIISKSNGEAYRNTNTSTNVSGNCKVISIDVQYSIINVYGTLTGWSIIGNVRYPVWVFGSGIVNNLYINSTDTSGDFAIKTNASTTKINNCVINTAGNGIGGASGGGIINNCTVYANGSGISCVTGEVNNCNITSIANTALSLGVNSYANECYARSAAGRASAGTSSSAFFNCVLVSDANVVGTADSLFSNCTLLAKAETVIYTGGGGKFTNCTVKSNYNSGGGHCFHSVTSNTYIVDCYLEVLNSSAFAIYSTLTPTLYLKGNSVKGTTNFKSAGIVNGQTNTADAQGNIILQ